jgi:predicted RNA-binding protein with PUA-like domain
MAKWLVRSEPGTYSFDDLKRDGKTAWDGVRNNTAALHLKAMKVGEEVFFYHSGEGKEVVGIAKVAREAYLDPTDPAGRFVAIELAYVRPIKTPVTLVAMQAEPALAEMAMIKLSRISVSPVRDAEWAKVLEMAGE